MNDRLWVVARFPDGSWSEGGKAEDPVYEGCEIFKVVANGAEQARKKAQALRRRNAARSARGTDPTDRNG